MDDHRRVDLVADAKGGLYLCPCDIHPGNFRKRSMDGQLFALDFSETCFMPPSFFGVAMMKAWDTFCQQVASKITYNRRSDEILAMVSASNYLVPFGQGQLGKQCDCFSSSLFLLLLFGADFPSSLYSVPTRSQSQKKLRLLVKLTLLN